jgi:hypothetical protein
VVQADRFFPDGDGALIERLSLRIAVLPVVQQPQTIETLGDVGMFGSKHFFTDRQGTLAKGLGLSIPPAFT